MPAGPLIGHDQRCKSCGYNLRGLTMDRNCPECGEPVCHSLRFRLRAPHPVTQDDVRAHDLLADGYRAAAESLGLHPAAVRFVHAAMRYAIMSRPDVNLTARDLCAALREYAKYHFGGESNAILELADLRIRDSQDVGRIVYALVDAGILRVSEGDSQSDFARLFTLDDMFTADL